MKEDKNPERDPGVSRRQFLSAAASSLVVAGANIINLDAFAQNKTQSPLKVVGPVPYPGLQRWLCAEGDDDTLYTLRQLGCDGIRYDAQLRTTSKEVAVVADRALKYGLTPLVIVKDDWQIADLPAGAHVEVRNEPNLDTNEKLSPQEYAIIAHRCVAAAQRRSEELKSLMPVWVGAVGNLAPPDLSYMKMLFSDRIKHSLSTLPPEVGVSIHRYPEGTSPSKPHKPFLSREHEVETFRKIIGSRSFGISEVGYHTAPNENGDPALNDDDVLDRLRYEFDFWAAQGAKFCTIYQVTDGPDDTPINRFGIRRVDGTWKRSAEIFRYIPIVPSVLKNNR